ncbi:hypothetical protein DL766_002997 [Monosporascus sp. MC13-8B]|uniref:Protein prenyltransferase n=1 Tax=Monosporascus cannonballus TaxID=155416 RepID=A0ABY0GZG8_9PEZI|nr:hypothetical protein DL762_008444 [Monosporascus cannonballus]RYP34348.1 hypothetical protein DL766_002997 [Monosporascus sp. MC13-8B]
MSRSLDKSILVRLQAEDAGTVYNDISRILTELPANNELLEIEVFGEDHPLEPGVNFLQDGAAVAIPKLRIAQAFFVARRILYEYLMDGSRSLNDQVTRATSTVLLMDPEHLTASNVRKRAVLSLLKDQGSDPSLVLKGEMQFVDSLLTSHLHRHTKSPTLWGHRRWLVQEFMAHGIPMDQGKDMTNVIMVAAERHPRNYYAWDHARWLFRHPARWGISPESIATVADDVKRWCFKHPSDTSGWSFLMSFIERIPDEELRPSIGEAILSETLELTDIFRWTNESVWVFLRTLVAKNYNNQRDIESFAAINDKLTSLAEAETYSRKILGTARNWCETYHLEKP